MNELRNSKSDDQLEELLQDCNFIYSDLIFFTPLLNSFKEIKEIKL